MNISKLVSTVILATVIFSIYLFGLIFWLYSSSNDKTLVLLKESLSTTSSFFGGTATLIAAYIATKLFNDWREQEHVRFIRQLAYDNAKDVANLMMLMLDFDKTDLSYLTKLKTMHCLITVNLNILDKNLNNPEFSIVKDNFSIFFSDFLDVVKNNLHDDSLRKSLTGDVVKSFSAEYDCISKFTVMSNIPNVKKFS